MAQCTNCGDDCDFGFSTCSSTCNLEYRTKDRNQQPKEGMTALELAAALGMNVQKIYKLTSQKRIPYTRELGPRSTRYDLEQVKLALSGVSESELKLSDPEPVDLGPPMITVKPGIAGELDLKHFPAEIGKPNPNLGVKETLRSVLNDLMLERAHQLEASGETTKAYFVLKDYLHLDRRITEAFDSLVVNLN